MRETLPEIAVCGKTPTWYSPEDRGWQTDDPRWEQVPDEVCIDDYICQQIKRHGDHELWVHNYFLGYVYLNYQDRWCAMAGARSMPHLFSGPHDTLEEAQDALEEHVRKTRSMWIRHAAPTVAASLRGATRTAASFEWQALYVRVILARYGGPSRRETLSGDQV